MFADPCRVKIYTAFGRATLRRVIAIVLWRWSIITEHRLVSSNDQAIDYDVELSIVSRNYVAKQNLLQLKYKIISANFAMSTIQNNVDIWQILIYIPNGVTVDINPSSHRPRAEILKTASIGSATHRRSVVKIEPIANTCYWRRRRRRWPLTARLYRRA